MLLFMCLFLFLLNRLSHSTLSNTIKEDFVMLFGFSLKEDEPTYINLHLFMNYNKYTYQLFVYIQ